MSYPGGHCYIRIVGVAPGANVVALKAGSELLPNSAILQAIDYAVTVAHVDVLNESFGANLYPDSGARNTIQALRRPSGRQGRRHRDRLHRRRRDHEHDRQSVAPTRCDLDRRDPPTRGCTSRPATRWRRRFGNGKWLDGNISSLSSAGITQNGRTIDLSAPGEADWAVCDDSGNFTGCTQLPWRPTPRSRPSAGPASRHR